MMRSILPRLACLLLLWSLSHCDAVPKMDIKKEGKGLELTCTVTDAFIMRPSGTMESSPLTLQYEDDLSGEYSCTDGAGETVYETVYVKLRSCDDCIDLHPTALASISIADVVATALIGWAVYLVVCRAAQAGVLTSDKKSSDKKRLIPNSNNRNHSNTDDTYQPLRPHDADLYSALQAGNRR